MPAPAIPPTEAQLLEVFSSIQGEGLLVGCRQVFVRFARCNLACAYCDTPHQPQDDCRIEDAPGSGEFRSLPNPVSLDLLYNILFQWRGETAGIHHSLSLTGGEPLLQGDILAEWLPKLRQLWPVCLETNGTLPAALEPLLLHLDWIAMDLKLPSMTGAPVPWEDHREFLALARRRPCYVKAVVGEETPPAEIEDAARLVRSAAPEVTLILQPVTREGRVEMPPRLLLELHTLAARIHANTRIIPQTHRLLGVP